MLQELRTIAIYDNTKAVKIFFLVLDVVAGIAFVVLRKIQPTKSARKIKNFHAKLLLNSFLLLRIHDISLGAVFCRRSDDLSHVSVQILCDLFPIEGRIEGRIEEPSPRSDPPEQYLLLYPVRLLCPLSRNTVAKLDR